MDKTKPIIALDVASSQELNALLQDLAPESLTCKVGMECYYSQGPAVVKSLLEAGHQVFLDLKLHDIPNTVAKSVAVLSQLGCHMLNVHAQGGISSCCGSSKCLQSSAALDCRDPVDLN